MTEQKTKRVLAFDIGIKNLAWCCADVSSASASAAIQGWANENLVSGETAEEGQESDKCFSCPKKAGHVFLPTGRSYCVRHAPPLTPVLRDLSGNVLKKVPAMGVLKVLAERLGADKPTMKTKQATVEFLEKHLCFPKVKVVVKKVELADIHDGMRAFVLKNAKLFGSCNEILLENQPVYKNPVMKSVQMMLFATLRDLLPGPPAVRLVHAGRKTAGATGGDEGYTERKDMSEARVVAGFTCGKIVKEGGLAWFTAQKKRSDLADCLCMALDAVV